MLISPPVAQLLSAGEVVMKNGGERALMPCGDENCHMVAALSVADVDATETGHSSNGAYLAARLRLASVFEAVRSAHRVAAIIIGNHGALIEMTLGRQPK